MDSADGRARGWVTIPNILSLARLGSVPVFVWLFLTDRENAAVLLYGAGAWTDFLDGWIARRYDMVTELGKLLDPLADRIFIVTLAVALVARGTLVWWLAAAVILRDLAVLSLFPLLERKGIPRIAVNRVGKAATAALLAGLTSLAWSVTSFPAHRIAGEVGVWLVVLGAVLYWVAGGMYARVALSRLRAMTGPAR